MPYGSRHLRRNRETPIRIAVFHERSCNVVLQGPAQAYIHTDADGTGEFQFGYVAGGLDGKVVKYLNENRFEFSWSGADEMDPVNGCGWVRIRDSDTIEGEFRIYLGDDSIVLARKV
jgi:hypothetical protein